MPDGNGIGDGSSSIRDGWHKCAGALMDIGYFKMNISLHGNRKKYFYSLLHTAKETHNTEIHPNTLSHLCTCGGGNDSFQMHSNFTDDYSSQSQRLNVLAEVKGAAYKTVKWELWQLKSRTISMCMGMLWSVMRTSVPAYYVPIHTKYALRTCMSQEVHVYTDQLIDDDEIM